eukprot:1085905-Ditylum_brightwellii.AAC.1
MGFKQGGASNLVEQACGWKEEVKKYKHPVPFDIANLMWECSWLYASQIFLGDYSCTVSKLKQYLAAFAFKKLDLIYVLDGRSNPYKGPENL